MLLDLHPTRSAKFSVARSLLAVVALCALLSSAVPLGTVLAAHNCAMPCCVGKAWTAACANGSCHVDLPTSPKVESDSTPDSHCDKTAQPTAHQETPQAGGHIAGQMDGGHMAGGHTINALPASETASTNHHRVAQQQAVTPQASPPPHATAHHPARSPAAAHNREPPTPTIAALALTRPCPPACSGIFSFSNSHNRGRDGAILAYASKPRPPTLINDRRDVYKIVAASTAQRQPCRPRGPPGFFLLTHS